LQKFEVRVVVLRALLRARPAGVTTVSVRSMGMVAGWTPQQQQYIQKDKVVEPPQIVIKLRKAGIILYTGLRKF
jgi:hypothetical protein